ncbi:MAG: 2,3,4,5-tetrahydropyridine-2,6-dicarboxylate N-succinyltransferase, partial [Pseudomonadota bacterium]
MSTEKLQHAIESVWDRRTSINADTQGADRTAVEDALDAMDRGAIRVAEPMGSEPGGNWQVNEWVKKSVLLSFRLNPTVTIPGGPGQANWFDKVPSKFDNWDQARFQEAGFRAVPGAIVRHGSFIDKDTVLMPSFVNIGGYVGSGAMIDTWA